MERRKIKDRRKNNLLETWNLTAYQSDTDLIMKGKERKASPISRCLA